MQFLSKLLLTNMVILGCAAIGRRYPALGGLIATMPLTSLMVLIWLYADSSGDRRLMSRYTEGALWGIVPTILFFLAAYLCFRKELSFPVALAAGFGVWLAGAAVHQYFLR